MSELGTRIILRSYARKRQAARIANIFWNKCGGYRMR